MARFSPAARRTLLVAGAIVAGVGVVLFATFLTQSSAGFDAIGDGRMPQHPNVLLPFGGMTLMFIGAVMLMLGGRKTMAELHATDVAPATEHLAHAVGSGLARSGVFGGQVRFRCAHCGGLDSEDAAFCSACGKPMRPLPKAR